MTLRLLMGGSPWACTAALEQLDLPQPPLRFLNRSIGSAQILSFARKHVVSISLFSDQVSLRHSEYSAPRKPAYTVTADTGSRDAQKRQYQRCEFVWPWPPGSVFKVVSVEELVPVGNQMDPASISPCVVRRKADDGRAGSGQFRRREGQGHLGRRGHGPR